MRLSSRQPAGFIIRAVLAVALVTAACVGMAQAGEEKVLHRFNTLWNGAASASTLIADAAGNLYGTAEGGGAQGRGVVFKLTKSKDGAWKESVLHSFGSSPDGFQPTSSLTFDAEGNLMERPSMVAPVS